MTCQKNKSFWRYNVTFLIVCVIGYSPLWIFGKSLIWKIDGLGQYYPSFLYVGQYLREYISNCIHGNFVLPLFDLSIGMGDDIIGTLNYYGFGDPLNILSVFATKENGAYIFTGMYILRLYLAGICFKKYCSYFGLDDTLSITGAFCYIFSGYAIIGGVRYIQFLTPMIYLPLILLGSEKIFRENKPVLFILSVAYAALCNFYFFYMVSLFLFVYCTVRCFSIYGIKRLSKIFKTAVVSIGSYLLGIMLAAPILLPSIYAFLNSDRNSTNPINSLLYIENYLLSTDKWMQYIRGWRIARVDHYWTGIPLVQCVCLIGSVFFYKSKRCRQCALALILGTVFWCMPITSIVFSGFGKVYTRWVFLLYFVYAIVFVCFADKIVKKKIGREIVFLLVVINICFNLMSLYGKIWNDEFVAFSDTCNYTDSPVNGAECILEDDGIYRIANETFTDINGRPENIAMLNEYNSLNFWFSIINGNVQRMVDQIGTYKKTDWRSYGLNNITAYESMAGVKYYVRKEDGIEKMGYKRMEAVTFGDGHWSVYENRNALPLIYTYNECVTEEYFNQLDELSKVESALRYVALNDGCISPISRMEPSLIYEMKMLKEKTEGKVSIECYANDDEIYLVLESDELYSTIDGFTLNNDENLRYSGNRSKNIIYNLGMGFADSKLIFSMDCNGLEIEELDRILERTRVYAMDSERYEELIQERNELGKSDISVTQNRVRIENAHVKDDCWALLALPYSSNWKCYVDGEKTEICKGNAMYMAVRLEEGEHEILFVYNNVSFYIGIVLCVIALVFLHSRLG